MALIISKCPHEYEDGRGRKLENILDRTFSKIVFLVEQRRKVNVE